MALLDDYLFNHQTFAGLLGRPAWARPQEQAPAAFNTPSQLPSEPAFDLSYYNYGGQNVPVYGQPQSVEMSSQARAAPQAQPSALNQPAPQLQQPGGFRAGMEGFVNNLHTGPMGAARWA
jgi:hypothetical protein